jgi:pilus assembly protein Flp/PilA
LFREARRQTRNLQTLKAWSDVAGGFLLLGEQSASEICPRISAQKHIGSPVVDRHQVLFSGKDRPMKKLYDGMVNFLQKEDGPTAVEYAVMLALIIVVCLVAIQILGKNANSAFGTVGASIGAATGS